MTLKTSAQAFQEKGITIGKVEFWYHLSFSRKVISEIKKFFIYIVQVILQITDEQLV